MKTALLTSTLVLLAAVGCSHEAGPAPPSNAAAATPGATAEQPAPPSQEAQAGAKSAESKRAGLPLPGDATLVSSAAMAEVEEFPQAVPGKGKAGVEEEAAGVRGSDRLYETRGSYFDTITFYLRSLPAAGFQLDSQTSTRTTTTWSARRPDGSPVRLVVRNTTPTTVEWITASATTTK